MDNSVVSMKSKYESNSRFSFVSKFKILLEFTCYNNRTPLIYTGNFEYGQIDITSSEFKHFRDHGPKIYGAVREQQTCPVANRRNDSRPSNGFYQLYSTFSKLEKTQFNSIHQNKTPAGYLVVSSEFLLC